jgi:RHS repeat-associated protein
MRTTYNGGFAAAFTSLPFGDAQTTVTGQDFDAYHFAGMDEDGSSDDAQYRKYNPTQGHWLSTDPYDGSYDFSNPQSFNRYSYALNNPLSFVDPLGLQLVDVGGNCFQSITSWNISASDYEGAAGSSSGTDFGGTVCIGDTVRQAQIQYRAHFWVPRFTLPIFPSRAPIKHSNPVPIKGFQICGAGAFAYGGRSLDAGPVNGFAGGIVEADTSSGFSKGALFELGGGEGYIGGVGKIISPSAGGLGSSNLAYGGVGGELPGAHAAAGVVGFSSGGGVFGEISAGGREVGIGLYLDVASTGGCR